MTTDPFAGDTISLTGLRADGHHGVFEHERRDGQIFVIDVTVAVDLDAASMSDDLEKTVHYGHLAEQVVAAVERDPVDLLNDLDAARSLVDDYFAMLTRVPLPIPDDKRPEGH